MAARLDPRRLPDRLPATPAGAPLYVAFSGGLDSTVLLHALATVREALPGPLKAIHVDHGLQPDANRWADHCRRICDRLDLPLSVERVEARPAPGESPEAAAREARYACFRRLLGEGELLLTAHHRDDQAETLLLQLLRGAGPRGLAAMPAVAPLGRGWLVRPLLDLERDALRDYARHHGLRWIDDPTNAESRFDRNYLRHQVIPVLKRRWPGLSASLARSARHCAEADQLARELAALDLERCRGAGEGTLDCAALAALSDARRRNLVRHWLRSLGLSLPGEAKLRQGLADLLGAREDGAPRLLWPGGELCRYRGMLHAFAPLPGVEGAWSAPFSARGVSLPDGTRLEVGQGGAGELLDPAQAGELRVGYRRGGERIRPAGRRHRVALKKLLQERGVPPWLRPRWPLLLHGDEVVAVAGLCIAEGWRSAPGEAGLALRWTGARAAPSR